MSIVNVVLISALATTGLAIGPMIWAQLARRNQQGQPLVDFTPRRNVPWSVAELAAIVAVYFLLSVAAYFLARPSASADASPEQLITFESLLAVSFASLLTTGFGIVLVRLSAGATIDDLGLNTVNLLSDLALGAMAFAAILGPLYLMQALLGLLTDERHPIIELLQKQRDPRFFAVAAVSAVLVAPLAEEFFFRVLLQGWLERIWPRRSVIGNPAAAAPLPAAPMPTVPSTADDNPYAAPLTPLHDPAAATSVDDQRTAWGPIIISSLVFALMHVGHGADPVPLFFLALVLGYLYGRTHRIWPSLALHTLVNGCSLLMLWTAVNS